ncbi:MAG: T9SS type A sorting domain-containing protein, partial [Bacteroidia bacterium]|nr:T9SS type A sorting domain-containing protein [Bacteroidia bacterium]
ISPPDVCGYGPEPVIGAPNPGAPSGPVLSFAQTRSEVNEAVITLDFNVTLNNPSANPTTVEVVLDGTAGTASPGSDFNFNSPTLLSFPANSTTAQSFSINILDDNQTEEAETIVLTLVNEDNNALVANGRLVVTIAASDLPVTPIATLRNAIDALGFPTTEGVVSIQGVLHGPNFDEEDYILTVVDGAGPRDGIGLFIPANAFDDLEVPDDLAEGDEVMVEGEVSAFNGLMQIENVRFFERISRDNMLQSPAVVDSLDENSESRLVELRGVSIFNASQWQGNSLYTGSGFTVDLVRGDDILTMRIDGATELAKLSFQEVFASEDDVLVVIGIGSQFDADNSDGLLAGYQILPYQVSNIVTSLPDELSSGTLSIFPNPSANGKYYLKSEGELAAGMAVRVYSQRGEWLGDVQAPYGAGVFELDLSTFAPGHYLLEITVGQEKISRRIVKE